MNNKIILAIVIAILGIGQVDASQQTPFTYSIKYLCGLQRAFGNPPFELAVKPGNYATSINIHNYHNTSVVVLHKVVVSDGIISPIRLIELRPNQAIAVDCTNISKSIPSGLPPFIEGFVELGSNQQLSVTAVYTTQGCKDSAAGACTVLGELALDVVPQQAFID